MNALTPYTRELCIRALCHYYTDRENAHCLSVNETIGFWNAAHDLGFQVTWDFNQYMWRKDHTDYWHGHTLAA